MPTAPPDCTHNHSECRIVVYNQRSVNVALATPPVYDGNGVAIITTPTSTGASEHDCLCETCGLMWTEQSATATPTMPAAPTLSNIRKAGA